MNAAAPIGVSVRERVAGWPGPATRRRLAHGLLSVAVLLAAVAFVYRVQIANGFTRLFSDGFDGNIEVAILEHWYNVFRGRAAWDTTAYFFPHRGTLAYDDGYLLYGIPYAALRGASIDPLLAAELVHVAVTAIGFASFAACLRRIVGLGLLWSLFGAYLFTTANNIALQAVHAQLFAVSFAPLLALLLHGAALALRRGRTGRLLLLGGLAALLWGSWLMTGYYMAWFATFFGAAVALAWIALAPAALRRDWVQALRRHWRAAALVAGAAALATLPLLLLYLPKARTTGMHSFAETLAYGITPVDIVHLAPGNLVWGWLDRWLTGHFQPDPLVDVPHTDENMTGLPIGLLVLFAVGVVRVWRRDADRGALLRAVALATLVTWALTIRIGTVTPWQLVWALVPGAKAVRVVERYQILLDLPVITIAIAALAALARRWPAPLTGLVCALLAAEQVATWAPVVKDRPGELAFLRRVPQAPTGCRAFYVSRSRGESSPNPVVRLYTANVDAMMIAETRDLPTINGIATFGPPDWRALTPSEPGYRPWVESYALHHHLHGLCAIDLQHMAWTAAR
ncbi:MAG TPA: hypothetical protein VME92_05790 [Acetobacteraceae bacterium]|nr:hypothetical protein [Acetobacteraceae bacterium]